jgi:hypothetical protein
MYYYKFFHETKIRGVEDLVVKKFKINLGNVQTEKWWHVNNDCAIDEYWVNPNKIVFL